MNPKKRKPKSVWIAELHAEALRLAGNVSASQHRFFLKWRQHMAKNLNLMACTSLTRLPEETARVAVFLCLAIGLLPTCNIQ
ncbi:hypothetical protein ACFQD2_19635 [Pseudomonas lini]